MLANTYFTRPRGEEKKRENNDDPKYGGGKTSGARMINKRVLPDIFFVPTQLLATHATGRNHSHNFDICQGWKFSFNIRS